MNTKVIGLLSSYHSRVVELPLSDKYNYQVGDEVIFRDDEDKEEYGVIKYLERDSDDKDNIFFTSKIIRRATANDAQKVDSHVDQAKHALDQCKKLIEKHNLDMQVFKANYSFDGTRLMFMFTADERIDFRDLVKDLARDMQKKIYLRQIGPRDKAKVIGGYGKCGRPLCCSSFLGKLESISMEMVRIQALESKGSSKLSGSCGKLLCCLKYEVDAYKELKKLLPNISEMVNLKGGVDAPEKKGKVIALDILNQKVKMYFPTAKEVGVYSSKELEYSK